MGTNAFHVNSRSELALVYNDKSVLENHHAHITFEILLEKSCNIVENLEETEFKRLREIIINCILNTDMATHHTQLAKLEEINRLGGFSGLAENADQRLFVLSVLLHTSDLYPSIKPFDTAKRWAQRLQKEYNNQVELESKMGLPSLPFMRQRGGGAGQGRDWLQQLCHQALVPAAHTRLSQAGLSPRHDRGQSSGVARYC